MKPPIPVVRLMDPGDPVVNVLIGYEFMNRGDPGLYQATPAQFIRAALDEAKRKGWLGADVNPRNRRLRALAIVILNERRFAPDASALPRVIFG